MQVRPRPWVVNGVHTSHDHDAENAAVFALYPIRDQTASLLLMLRIKGRKNRRGSRHFGSSVAIVVAGRPQDLQGGP